MLGEFKVNRCSRQCYHEKRPLKEGEWYFSVVLQHDEEYERRDYCARSWQGPPEGTLGHWKCRMPTAGDKKWVLAPRAVLIDLLRQMEDVPEQAKTRFLLALILLRKRFVRVLAPPNPLAVDRQDSPRDQTAAIRSEANHSAAKQMHLEVVDDGSTIDVNECVIGKSEAESLSETLNDLLYCEASEIEQE